MRLGIFKLNYRIKGFLTSVSLYNYKMLFILMNDGKISCFFLYYPVIFKPDYKSLRMNLNLLIIELLIFYVIFFLSKLYSYFLFHTVFKLQFRQFPSWEKNKKQKSSPLTRDTCKRLEWKIVSDEGSFLWHKNKKWRKNPFVLIYGAIDNWENKNK